MVEPRRSQCWRGCLQALDGSLQERFVRLSTVALEAQALATPVAGVRRYITGLMRHLPELCPELRYRAFYFDFRRRFDPVGILSPPWQPLPLRSMPGQLYTRLALWGLAPRLPLEADLTIFPAYRLFPVKGGLRLVVVYDLTFWHHPELADPRTLPYLKRALERILAEADLVGVLSRHVGAQLAEEFGLEPRRLLLLPPVIDPAPPLTAVPQVPGLTGRYLLAVGTIEPRKNLMVTLEALELLVRQMRPCPQLVVVGARGWRDQPIVDALARCVDDRRAIWLEQVDDVTLGGLYKGALALVYPSLEEGFGIPPLEAMAHDCPVIASDRAAVPEVVGDAALLVDPQDPWALAQAVAGLAEDQSLRHRLTLAGRSRLEQFSPQQSLGPLVELMAGLA